MLQMVGLDAQPHVHALIRALHVVNVARLLRGLRLQRLRPAQRSVLGQHAVQLLAGLGGRHQRPLRVQPLLVVAHQRPVANDSAGRQHHLEFVAIQRLRIDLLVDVHGVVLVRDEAKIVSHRNAKSVCEYILTLSG